MLDIALALAVASLQPASPNWQITGIVSPIDPRRVRFLDGAHHVQLHPGIGSYVERYFALDVRMPSTRGVGVEEVLD